MDRSRWSMTSEAPREGMLPTPSQKLSNSRLFREIGAHFLVFWQLVHDSSVFQSRNVPSGGISVE